METRNLQRQFEVLERYGWKRGAYNVGLTSSGVTDGNEETYDIGLRSFRDTDGNEEPTTLI